MFIDVTWFLLFQCYIPVNLLVVKMLISFLIELNWFVISSFILFYILSVRAEAAKITGCNSSTAEPKACEIHFVNC